MEIFFYILAALVIFYGGYRFGATSQRALWRKRVAALIRTTLGEDAEVPNSETLDRIVDFDANLSHWAATGSDARRIIRETS